ncbi:MAG: hypothetical protein RLY71_1766 [Pseudomonadota bacterium]|jgi:hypothetical protein
MTIKRHTPRATAMLIVINAKLYQQEREREISRYRFSHNTLRRFSGRNTLRQSFLSELSDELAELRWMFVPLGAEFAVVDLSKSDSWVKLSSKRVGDQRLLDADAQDIEDRFNELMPVEDETDSDD